MKPTMRGKTWRPGRQTPKVKNGKVQKKQRWDYYTKEYNVSDCQGEISIIREPAFRRYRHLVSEQDLHTFIGIIPGWEHLSKGLKGIVLGDGNDNCYGWSGVDLICIHAWDSGIIQTFSNEAFLEDRVSLERLMVPFDYEEGEYTIHFTRKTATAYLLTNVFLHELGHHHDRMQTKAKLNCPNGESFAQDFADDLMDKMWPTFCRAFAF